VYPKFVENHSKQAANFIDWNMGRMEQWVRQCYFQVRICRPHFTDCPVAGCRWCKRWWFSHKRRLRQPSQYRHTCSWRNLRLQAKAGTNLSTPEGRQTWMVDLSPCEWTPCSRMLCIGNASVGRRTRNDGSRVYQRASSWGKEIVTQRRHLRRFVVLHETYCVQVNI
jgi:hypothetical protein